MKASHRFSFGVADFDVEIPYLAVEIGLLRYNVVLSVSF